MSIGEGLLAADISLVLAGDLGTLPIGSPRAQILALLFPFPPAVKGMRTSPCSTHRALRNESRLEYQVMQTGPLASP